MRMNRYFKRSAKIVKIENFLGQCKLGDWFVLYQLSKNLNRPFFMDFLTHLSVRYSNGHVCDEEDPDDEAGLIEQMNNYIRPTYKDNKTLMGQMDRIVKPEDYKEVLPCKHDYDSQGDNILEMLLKPKISLDEVDTKEKKDDDDEKDGDDNEQKSIW